MVNGSYGMRLYTVANPPPPPDLRTNNKCLQTDLNAGPGSLPYGLQRSVAGLGDAFAEARPGQAGNTCEAPENVFSNGRCVREKDESLRLGFCVT